MVFSATWKILPSDPRRAVTLAQHCGVVPLIGQLLLNRGVREPTDARRFLSPRLEALGDPRMLPQMERAVARLRRAIVRHEPILIFGDSDVDGITATAILSESLSEAGARISVRISNRLSQGYGFPKALIGRLVRAGIRLVILVDCGTNQQEEVRELAAQGIETIILDHHVPSASAVAKPMALVNPHGGDGPGRELCSAGLALKVVQALWPDDLGRLEPYLDLAALGTLADCAPLVGESRILVTEGMKRLAVTSRRGLAHLCESVRLSAATPEQVLRRLVPRLNAAGRMGNAKPVWRLLIERTAAGARRYASVLGQAHDQSKALSRQILAEAHELAGRLHFKDHVVVVVGRQGWHPGLMGPVAAQLADRFARPAIAIALDGRIGVGSGRSVSDFNLLDALRACDEMLLRYGGHPQACGLTIQATRMESFRESINRHVREALGPQRLARSMVIDVETSLAEMTAETLSGIEQLRPFGPGNPAPLLLVRRLEVASGRRESVWVTDGQVCVRVTGRTAALLMPGRRYDMVGMPRATEDTMVWSVRDVRFSVGGVTAL